MPATSAKQRAAMAIAEHDPDKLYASNRGMLKMSQSQLHDFASTKGLGAPKGNAAPTPAPNTTVAKSLGAPGAPPSPKLGAPKTLKPKPLGRVSNAKSGLIPSNRKLTSGV